MTTIQIGKNLPWVVAPEEDGATVGTESFFTVSKRKWKVGPRKPRSQANRILALAKAQGWEDVRRVGRGGMIGEPLETNGWLVMPIEMYKGSIPFEAFQRESIIKARVKVKGFLIADDQQRSRQGWNRIAAIWPRYATELKKISNVVTDILQRAKDHLHYVATLPPSKRIEWKEITNVITHGLQSAKQRWTSLASIWSSHEIDWKKSADVLGKVALAAVIVMAISSLLPVILLVMAIGAGLVYDPLLIAVTEEDEWICLYEWWH